MTRTIDDDSAAARLRREFDDIFARPPDAPTIFESFLGLGLRGDAYALRLGQFECVLTERKVLPLPTSVTAFAGLTAHRGALVPVFDLGMLLGYAAAATLRWLVMVRASSALVGLAFERFDGHLRVPVSDSSSDDGRLSIVAGLPDGRPVIDIVALVESVLDLQTGDRSKGARNS
jgi:chemotaxis signal transduction protein